MSNPNLVALTSYAGEHSNELMTQFYRELKLQADGIQVVPGITSKRLMPRLRVGRGLKPYNGNFASAPNQLRYADRFLEVEKAQRDLEINPELYRTTYLSKFASDGYGSNANKEGQIPFAQFTFEQYMKENAQEVVDLMYHGRGKAAFPTYNSASTYAVGALVSFPINVNGKTETNYFRAVQAAAAGQDPASQPARWENVNYLAITKGYNQVFTDAINNEGFNQVVNTGAITQATAIDQFKSVYRRQIDQVKSMGAVIYSSNTNFETLLDAVGEKYKNFTQTDDVMYLPETNRKAIVKPVDWLRGSNRLICTLNNNLLMGTNQLSDMNTLTTIPQHYTLETSLSFLIGFQVQDLDVLVINDQQ